MNKEPKARTTIAPSVAARLEATVRRLEREYFAEPYNKKARQSKLGKEIRRACRLLGGKTPYALTALDTVLTPIYSVIAAIECGGNMTGIDDASVDAYYTNEDGSCEKEDATHVTFCVTRCGESNDWELLVLVAVLFGIPAAALENDSLDCDRASADVPVSLFR